MALNVYILQCATFPMSEDPNPKPVSMNAKLKDRLPQKYLNKLTPEAENLTRGDLLKIARQEELPPRILKITLGDLKTLNEVLIKSYSGEDVGLARAEGVSCCCTCCCCCGVASINP